MALLRCTLEEVPDQQSHGNQQQHMNESPQRELEYSCYQPHNGKSCDYRPEHESI